MLKGMFKLITLIFFCLETIENVEPSIVISVDKRGSKLRKRKKSKRRKKRSKYFLNYIKTFFFKLL